jgi:hypothetical protein
MWAATKTRTGIRLSASLGLAAGFLGVCPIGTVPAQAQEPSHRTSLCLEAPSGIEGTDLAGVRAVLPLGDSLILALQQGVSHITVLHRQAGSWRSRALGREGDGPGEFRWPNAMGLHEDGVWIADARTGRVTFLDGQLEVTRSLLPGLPHVARPFLPGSMRPLAGGALLHVPRFAPNVHAAYGPDPPPVPIEVRAGDGTPLHRWELRTGPSFVTLRGGSGVSLTLSRPLAPGLLLAASPSGRQVAWVEDAWTAGDVRLRQLDVESGVEGARHLQSSPPALSSRQRDSIAAAARDALTSLADPGSVRLGPGALAVPDRFPPVDGVAVSDSGEAWVRGWFDDRRQWLAVGEGGLLGTRVDPKQDVLYVGMDGVMATAEDAVGVSSLVWYARCRR